MLWTLDVVVLQVLMVAYSESVYSARQYMCGEMIVNAPRAESPHDSIATMTASVCHSHFNPVESLMLQSETRPYVSRQLR